MCLWESWHREELKNGGAAASLGVHLKQATHRFIWPKRFWRVGVVVVLACLGISSATAAKAPLSKEVGSRGSPGASALSLNGASVDPLSQITNKAVVLIFLSCECPISNRYAPEIRRLNAKFSARGMKFWLVYPNADETAKSITQHTNEYHLK